MATVKFILDCRAVKVGAAAPLKVSIGHQRRTALLPLNINLTPDQWDANGEKVLKHPNRASYNQIIARRRVEITDIINDLINRPGGLGAMTATEIKNAVKEVLCPKKVEKVEPKKEDPNTVAKFFTRYIENKGLRERTAEMYRVTWRRIEAWLGSEEAAHLHFSDINMAWIEDFDKFLAVDAPKPNGRRMHHANLKAVINYAIDHEVLDLNPYRRYRIKTNPTAKRNMSVEALRKIVFAQNLEPWMERHRDFFVLSFMLRGLNTVDLCSLPKPINGRVEWRRTKTGIPMSLKIEPEMQAIIEKYSGEELMLEFAEGRDSRNFNDKLSKALHKICTHINKNRKDEEVEVPDFTMYWARHTWATIAAKLDIADGTIDIGLGHAQNSVLDIYVERDTSKIDLANRRVLDYVLYGIDYREKPLIEAQKKKRGRPKKASAPKEKEKAA